MQTLARPSAQAKPTVARQRVVKTVSSNSTELSSPSSSSSAAAAADTAALKERKKNKKAALKARGYSCY